jgi:hypothetical protein
MDVGQRAAGVGEPVPAPVQAAEGVLDHVLRRRPVAEHEVGQADQAHGLGAVQRPDRRLGAAWCAGVHGRVEPAEGSGTGWII